MRHERPEELFRRYALYKLRKNNIPLTRDGLLIEIGITESYINYDTAKKNYHIRYGTDDDFLCWVEGAWMGQAVRRFIRTVKRAR